MGQKRVSAMQETGEGFGGQDEDTEIQNLPLYTERKADGIYRYRRRVPKNLVERVGKGYLYRNLGRTKKDVVGNWPEAHSDVEAILEGAQASAEKSAELIKRKDHRATITSLGRRGIWEGSSAAPRGGCCR